MRCHCLGHCPNDEPNGTCLLRPGGFCFAAVEQVYNRETHLYELERTLGCLAPEDEGSLLQCKGHLVPHEVPKSIECCKTELCNYGLNPNYFNIPPNNEFGIYLS